MAVYVIWMESDYDTCPDLKIETFIDGGSLSRRLAELIRGEEKIVKVIDGVEIKYEPIYETKTVLTGVKLLP